jgi:hypothetical protein
MTKKLTLKAKYKKGNFYFEKLPKGPHFEIGFHPLKCPCGLFPRHDGRKLTLRQRAIYCVATGMAQRK